MLDAQLLSDHIENELIKISLTGASQEQISNARTNVRSARAELTSLLTSHPGIYALLDALGSPLVGGKGLPVGMPLRDQPSAHAPMEHPEQWVGWQMLNPAPLHHYWARLQHQKGNAPAPKQLPASVIAVDFDESKRDHPRNVEQLWSMCEEAGARPLCAVPSKTVGNWHFYFLLGEPTWETLTPPSDWGTDSQHSRHVLAWNPVYRTFHPNQGLSTIWHPDLFDGEVIETDPSVFTKPVSPIAPPETPKPKRAPVRPSKPSKSQPRTR